MRTLALAAVVAACGSTATTSSSADAPLAVDAPAIDGLPPATGPLTVTVVDANGAPVAGATVVTQLATGEVLRVATTGANGQAATVTVAGGSATAGFVEPGGPRLVTAMGLAFGGSVTLRARPPEGAIAVDADLEPPSAVANAVGYLVQIPCRRHPVATVFGPTVGVWDDCIVAGAYAAAITAVDGGGASLAYTFVADVPVATTKPAFPGWSTDVSTYTITLAGAPITCAQCARFVPFRRTADGLRYEGGAALLPLTEGAGAQIVVPFAPSLVAPEIGESLAIPVDANVEARLRRTYTAKPSNDPIDLASVLVARITGVTVDPTGTRLALGWTTAPSGGTPTIALVDLRWKVVDGDGGVQDRAWTVLAPPAPHALTLPLLPDELAAFAPTLPGDAGDYQATLTLAADTAFAAYADVLDADWLAEVGGTGPVRGARTVSATVFTP
jgi:hypothetical protein